MVVTGKWVCTRCSVERFTCQQWRRSYLVSGTQVFLHLSLIGLDHWPQVSTGLIFRFLELFSQMREIAASSVSTFITSSSQPASQPQTYIREVYNSTNKPVQKTPTRWGLPSLKDEEIDYRRRLHKKNWIPGPQLSHVCETSDTATGGITFHRHLFTSSSQRPNNQYDISSTFSSSSSLSLRVPAGCLRNVGVWRVQEFSQLSFLLSGSFKFILSSGMFRAEMFCYHDPKVCQFLWGLMGTWDNVQSKETKSFGENFIMQCKDFIFTTHT